MSYPAWQGGHLYNPNDIVVPVTAAAPALTAIANADFESGDTAWTKTNFTIVNTPSEAFAGTFYGRRIYTGGTSASLVAINHAACVPGQSITLTCMIKPTGSNGNGGNAVLYWYDVADAFLSSTVGTQISTDVSQTWQQSTVTGIAPAGAVWVRAVATSYATTADGVVRVDNFVWNYTAPTTGLALVFKATQAAAATSANSEPVWPTTVGGTVTDGGVTWTGTQNSRVTWTAKPAVKTGTVEPTWPTVPGSVVSDGTVLWQCVSLRVTDVNCPNTKEVVIAAGKVYAVDKDIIRYSATVNPLDWTTKNDAGYLPYGLQTYGSNPVAALGLYRSNLAAFNSEGFQMWQVNEDPQQSALLDALPIGSTQHRALAPVSNDLFFLSSQGVRTVALSASSDSLQAGDVGMPIDSMVKTAMIAAVAAGNKPIATYYPPQGQYFLAFPSFPASGLTLTGDVPNGLVGTVFNYAYSVSGGVGPYTLSIISGSLPPGLAMSATGVVTGTATTVGNYSWTVQAVDSIGTIVTLPDTSAITVPAISIVGTPPSGEVAVAYSYTWGATGGTGIGYVWAVASGTIPAGTTLNTATGTLNGTPTTNATYNFTLRVTDSGLNTTIAAQTIVIAIAVHGYALNSGSGNVSVFDRSYAVIATVAGIANDGLGGQLAITPDRSKVYAAGNTGNVYVISAASNTITATIAASVNALGGLVMKNDGTKVYVAAQIDHAIYVIDVAGGTSSTLLSSAALGGNSPQVMVMNPVSDIFYFYLNNGTVRAYSTAGALLGTMSPGVLVQGMCFSNDGALLYMSAASYLYVYDLVTYNLSASYNITPSLNGIAWPALSPTQTKVFVSDSNDGNFYVLAAPGLTGLRQIATGNYGYHAITSKATGKIFMCGGGVIRVIDPTTETIVQSITAGSGPKSIIIP